MDLPQLGRVFQITDLAHPPQKNGAQSGVLRYELGNGPPPRPTAQYIARSMQPLVEIWPPVSTYITHWPSWRLKKGLGEHPFIPVARLSVETRPTSPLVHSMPPMCAHRVNSLYTYTGDYTVSYRNPITKSFSKREFPRHELHLDHDVGQSGEKDTLLIPDPEWIKMTELESKCPWVRLDRGPVGSRCGTFIQKEVDMPL